MPKKISLLYWCAAFVLLSPFRAIAAVPTGALQLDSSKIFEVDSSDGNFMCGWFENKWYAGTLNRDGRTFLAYATDLKIKKAKLKTVAESKKAKLRDNISRINIKNNKGKKACAKGPISSNPKGTPVATPKAGPPSATPVPSTSFGYFVGDEMTAKGKSMLKVPSNLSANIKRGAALGTANTCTGCHPKRIGRTYMDLDYNLPRSPMFFNFSAQDKADLTAWLNDYLRDR